MHVTTRSMVEFDYLINGMVLFDMPLLGRKFTWRRESSSNRLDRVLIDPFWLEKIHNLKVRGLNYSASDHIPLLLKSKEVDWGPKPFRSIVAWLSHPSFIKKVEEEWRRIRESELDVKLGMLKGSTKRWNRDVFRNIDANIMKLEKEIANVEELLENGVDQEGM